MAQNTEQCINILEDMALLLQKTQINLKKCPKQRLTPGYIESRIKCLEGYWATFRQAHSDLIKSTTREQRGALPYFVNEEFYIQEDRYLCMLGDLQDLLKASTSKVSEQMSIHNISREDELQSQVRLPRIQLPVFSGNYEDWPSFNDLYVSLVHKSTTLSDVQKLHYLKSSLSGEAASLLKHVQVTCANYTQAWDTLRHRYGNKRLIVNALLKRLFGQKRCSSQTAVQLKSLLDTTTEIINCLRNMNVNTDSWDPLIIFLIVQKLDPESHKEWEQAAYNVNSEELSTLADLTNFLESKFRTLELLTPSTTNIKITKERVLHVSTVQRTCAICNEAHTLSHCHQFNKMKVNERSEYVKKNKLCFNCLASGHAVFKCKVPISCHVCKRRHHTLLHQQKPTDAPAPIVESKQPTTSDQAVEEVKQVYTMISSYYNTKHTIALLATAVVILKSEQGRTTVLKALIDSGSQACFISEKATQILKLERTPVNLFVSGMESMKVRVRHEVNFQMLSRWESKFNLPVQAYVMTKRLSTNLPSSAGVSNMWEHLTDIDLADPTFYESSNIDLLLGVHEYAAILQQGLIKGPTGTPCAQNTNLGWIIMGGLNVKVNKREGFLTALAQEVNIEDLLKTMWEVDIDTKRKHTQKENLCEDIYKQTHKRNKEGRYIVKLPFNTEEPQCTEGNTRNIALRRFMQLERKLNQNPEFKREYTKVIEEYRELNHMEEIPEIEIKEKSVYLPHHAVIRCDKETTKTRVVFDASCKGSNGISLNDELLSGPVLQEDLRSLLIRWRIHAVCFVSDIEKMYRMILVEKEDTNYQRILWRTNSSDLIKDFRLLTVTFGTASAPYLAVKTLMQLAKDEGDRFPEAAKIVREDFYVDDVMSGCDDAEAAIKVSRDLKELLHRGGFLLKKWSSNSQQFMESINPSERSSNAHLELKVGGTIKALGIRWNLGNDQFEYNLNLPLVQQVITKRNILSDIQKLFDPLGWISPCIVLAKMLIQNLWAEKVSWDEPLNGTITEKWKTIRSDLHNVNRINVNRWIGTRTSEKDHIEIHGFSDASIQAYAAVVYCRVKKCDGSITTSLIASRTRVAPLKTISLPRLELCGALLLSRLIKQVGQAMRISASKIYAWTDSSIVISWLFGDPMKWKPFVANRVVEIISNVSSDKWHHVKSDDNPADIGSRGCLVDNLIKSDLWWNGPKWLSAEKIQFTRPNILPTDIEKKKDKVHILTVMKDGVQEERRLDSRFDEFDSLIELQRTIAICKRFLKIKQLNQINENVIRTDELQESLEICIKLAQEKEFWKEIQDIKTKGHVKRTSKLKSLDPYLDKIGLLRVGGRLGNAPLSDDSKHPIILGRENKLTTLIIANAHTKTLHGGVQLMMSYLRSRYWILRARSLVKQHVHHCLICAKLNARARSQIMGHLPSVRVTPARPFINSGVDFAGPFQVLLNKGRGSKTTKAYIAIFLCLSTKATHLELVGDLSSAAFIGAFKRFCARRGKCTNIWSDQGRNFVGANKELCDAWKEAGLQFDSDIAKQLANDGTQWHFIPAYSPNFGGLWEAGVKSTKFHLKRILTTNLTFEEMTTLLCEIEACLNSRPLCPLNDETLDPLTPGHFLIGEAPATVPCPNLKDVKMSNLTRWQFTQKLLHDFWSRWQKEYVTRLQQRPKWLKREKEFQIGDIVLIKQDNLPPGKWSLGRITDKHPGADGLTRVYSVRSSNCVIKRCVTKLCALPIDTK